MRKTMQIQFKVDFTNMFTTLRLSTLTMPLLYDPANTARSKHWYPWNLYQELKTFGSIENKDGFISCFYLAFVQT